MKGISRVTFPHALQGPAGELVKAILQSETGRCLPMQAGGWDAFKRHAWYKNFDWVGIMAQTSTPPYIPAVNNPRDMQNFQAREEDAPADAPYRGGDTIDWEMEFAPPPAHAVV